MTERILLLQTDIISMYRDHKIGMKDIARKLKINLKTVIKVLKLNGVVIRRGRTNILGCVFSRLTVVRYCNNDATGKPMWECKCQCGNTTVVRAADLLSGKVKSCGCLHAETSKENIKIAHLKYPHSYGFTGIEDIPGHYFSSLKNGAQRRGLRYEVCKEYLWKLFVDQGKKCALTGLPIYFRSQKKTNDRRGTASLDRIDSSKGYVEGNVQWVHKDINNMKQHFGLEEFRRYCKMVVEYKT